MSDIAEGVGVDFGIGTVIEEVGVAGELALRQESPAEPPNGGIEPMEKAGEMCQ